MKIAVGNAQLHLPLVHLLVILLLSLHQFWNPRQKYIDQGAKRKRMKLQLGQNFLLHRESNNQHNKPLWLQDKVKLVVIGESVTFEGSKDILDKFGIPWIDLADDRSITMMKNWRSIPANERLWQGDIGN